MNPKMQGTGTWPDKLPPLDEVRKNRRIPWYRSPIDRARLRELAEPSDIRGLVQAVGHLALWVCTGLVSYYLYSQEIWWGFFAVLYLHGIVASFFTAPHHELCHTTVFKTKWLNSFFLYIFSLLGWLNFFVYKFSHSYHHRFTLFIEGDREEVLPVKPSLRVGYLLQLFTINITGGYQSRGMIPTLGNFFKLALNRFDNPFNSWGEELYDGHPEEQAKARNWARTVLLFHASVVFISYAIGEPVIALIVSGSVFIANWHRYFVGVPMHCGLRSNIADFRKCVRTITLDPFSEFLYWHMNWHLEHHMYAAVPCYNLKKLHHVLAEDMPRPRTLIGAWKEMRATWIRQRTEPEYAYDTPLPEHKSDIRKANSMDALSVSIGGLAPQALSD